MKEKELFDIEKLISLVEENISKIYPVVYSTDFECGEHNVELAAECFIKEPDLKQIRKSMIEDALVTKVPDKKSKKDKPKPKEFKPKNTYKPFNIRELDVGKIIYNEEFSEII